MIFGAHDMAMIARALRECGGGPETEAAIRTLHTAWVEAVVADIQPAQRQDLMAAIAKLNARTCP